MRWLLSLFHSTCRQAFSTNWKWTVIRRLPGPLRPCARIIVGKTPDPVKQVGLGAHLRPAQRGLLGWLVMVVSSLLLCGFGPPRLVDREIAPTVRISVGELRALSEDRMIPAITAQSYLLYDLTTETLLFAQAAQEARAPASLTKLMTALLVLERADLQATLEIGVEDLSEGTSMGLAVGDRVTVTDLLWGLLLPSGNDAAKALARLVAGSEAAFVVEMNARAAQLGLQQSHFANAHGLDAEGHMSSAADLLLLTRTLWQYPLFRTMVGTARVQWNGRTLVNTNEWLNSFAGATGVKTGTTDQAGECLVAAVEREGSTVLLIVMGSTQRYADVAALYDAYESAFRRQQADGRDLSILNRVFDGAGKVWYMQPTGEAPLLLRNRVGVPTLQTFRRLAWTPEQTPSRGEEIGTLEWWAGGKLIGAQGLVVR
jgi:D-alanyl-D-alanine carboxypeptidase (penicillin-binding protein 5/6)